MSKNRVNNDEKNLIVGALEEKIKKIDRDIFELRNEKSKHQAIIERWVTNKQEDKDDNEGDEQLEISSSSSPHGDPNDLK